MGVPWGETGSGWSARSTTVSVVFGNWGRTESMTEVTQVETEGPTRGERVEQMMRAILMGVRAMVVWMLTGGELH